MEILIIIYVVCAVYFGTFNSVEIWTRKEISIVQFAVGVLFLPVTLFSFFIIFVAFLFDKIANFDKSKIIYSWKK